jgi:hypothetical protein
MQTQLKSSLVLTFFASFLAISACKKDKSGTFYGADQKVGNGFVRSYVTLDEDGEAIALGVSIDNAGTDMLSEDPNDHTHNDIVLPMHAKAAKFGFDHVLFNWAPEGHEPSGVYTLPHFDLHFYKQASAERSMIPPYELDSSKYNMLPSADYLPATYIRIPGGVPTMGVHWIDVTSPELSGASFTHTFIYGTYEGKNTFWEPMITLAAMKTATSEVVVDIKQPAKYEAG